MSVHDDKETARLAAEAKARGLQEWQVEASRAVPTDLVRSLVGDFRRPVSQNQSILPDSVRAAERPRGAPSSGTVELRPPPGIDIIDRMCAEQDAIDRAETIRRHREAARILKSQSK